MHCVVTTGVGGLDIYKHSSTILHLALRVQSDLYLDQLVLYLDYIVTAIRK